MNYFMIDGTAYNVTVTGLTETFNVLNYDTSGRTLEEAAPMVIDPIGTFIGHQITVKRKGDDVDSFDALYKQILKPIRVEKPEDAPLFEVAHCQETIAYHAYVSTGSRPIQRIDEANGKSYWGELTLNITPIKAQVLPDELENTI